MIERMSFAPSKGDVKDFSPTNALVCAQVARLAYESTSDLSARIGFGARTLLFENHAGMVLGLPSAVIVAFRGTDEIRGWMTNLAIWRKSPWPGWGVHAGS
jgi:hypothetical protein